MEIVGQTQQDVQLSKHSKDYTPKCYKQVGAELGKAKPRLGLLKLSLKLNLLNCRIKRETSSES